jgi:hypothetical protein
MIEAGAKDNHRNWNAVIIGVVLLAGGPILNYLFERHNFLAVWVNSAYPEPLTDALYPPLCVLLSLTGALLIFGGAMRQTTIRGLARYFFPVVIPLTVAYTLFTFAMQFVQTGADRLGECMGGLYRAAASSNVIPESKARPGQPAFGCAVERRGIFLSFYNVIQVEGVTDSAAQQLVLDRVAEYHREAHTHPVQVMFYDKEIWSVRQGKNGSIHRSERPGKLIRVVNIG